MLINYPTVFTDILRMFSIENYVFIITQSLTILLQIQVKL